MTTHGPLKRSLLAFGVSEADADALISEHDTAALREHAEKVHEVGTAKGWSVWAAAYLHPEVEFVDTALPATETIVAELRRVDRAAILRDGADRLLDERRQFASRTVFCDGLAHAAQRLKKWATEAAPEEETSAGSQPPAGESTPGPEHTTAETPPTEDARFARIREIHFSEVSNEFGDLECRLCREQWPCETIRAVDYPHAGMEPSLTLPYRAMAVLYDLLGQSLGRAATGAPASSDGDT
ncbi:hypothetical protein [Streptomyces sp. 1222.5]|uniref:hypothetical protein n=1 Tax=Streptomyces sp. 1222.5 TaxID=1881026 RepID=UPI003D75BB1B